MSQGSIGMNNNDYGSKSRNEMVGHNSMVMIESPRKLDDALVVDSPDKISVKPQTEKRFRSVPKGRQNFSHITVREMAVNGIRAL